MTKRLFYYDLHLEQLQKASVYLPHSIDRLGRWHCGVCGRVMQKEWNEEGKFWEWHCIFCGRWHGETEMLTEPAILEAYKEYKRRHKLGCK